MIFDPVYLLFVLPGLALSMWASRRVKSAFKKYATVRSARGLSGAEAAQVLLRGAGITDVRIVRAHGVLSDHYNPLTKTSTGSLRVNGQPEEPGAGRPGRGQSSAASQDR